MVSFGIGFTCCFNWGDDFLNLEDMSNRFYSVRLLLNSAEWLQALRFHPDAAITLLKGFVCFTCRHVRKKNLVFQQEKKYNMNTVLNNTCQLVFAVKKSFYSCDVTLRQ